VSARSTLVGRDEPRRHLEGALERAALGNGSLVLLSGEAGMGKTRLAGEVAAGAGGRVLVGRSSHNGTAPYGPMVAVLRAYLRAEPPGLDDMGALRPHLALILPELGEAAPAADPATLFEAVRCALAQVAGDDHALVILDDLHWSDEATVALLAGLADPLRELAVLVVAAYRSDGLPRGHGIRRLRNELRRAGLLDEVTLEPLDLEDTTELLGHLLEGAPSPAMARAIHDRTQGVPFFVEELATALRVGNRLKAGRRGLEVAGPDDVPLPDTVRDAVLISASELSAEARTAAEAAAVAGDIFDLDLVGRLAGDPGLAELIECGLVRDEGGGRAAFQHALTREALYADVVWTRRRALHRELAEALEERGAPSREIATHWLGAREEDRAREMLVRAAVESEAMHAYRDAAATGRQALELWPEGQDDDARNDLLERYARCCELAGELPEAARAWRELAAVRRGRGDGRATAGAQRRLAAIHELRGDREAAFEARRLAADAYAANDCSAEAAVERLAMANQLRIAARPRTPDGLTCICAPSGSRDSRGRSTATSRRGSRPSAERWRRRSSTT
jgi:predicted ATPase